MILSIITKYILDELPTDIVMQQTLQKKTYLDFKQNAYIITSEAIYSIFSKDNQFAYYKLFFKLDQV